MSNPKNQHFIPRVYLKYFKINPNSNQNECVYILDTLNIYDKKPKSKPLNSDYFKSEEYYNSIDFENDEYALEQALSKVETTYPALLTAINQKEQLSEKQKNDLLLFIMIAKLRSPIWRGDGYKHKKKLETFVLSFYENEQEPPNDEFLKENHLKKLTDFETMFNMSLNLCVKKWFIYETDINYPFITSDNPGMSINLNNTIKTPCPYWYIEHDTVLFFPLSATLCVVMGPFQTNTPANVNLLNDTLTYEIAKKELVDRINFYTYCTRNKLLISNSFTCLSELKKW